MPEQTILNLDYLWAQLIQVTILLKRPAVQIQILALIISILLAWLISKGFWIQLQQRFPKLSHLEMSELRLSLPQYGTALLRNLLAPTLSLIALSWLRTSFERWGWFAGYLSDGIKVLWYLWFYYLFLTSLYALVPAKSVNRYRQSFLAPLFFVFIIGIILNWFLDLQEISQITFVELFGESVTLESAFITVAGLYFWIVGASVLEKIVLNVFLSKNVQDARISHILSLVLRYFLIGLGIVLIFGYAGVSLTALAAITGGLSVGIGFGLKEIISNFVSGIWLVLEGALKPGDIITIKGKMSKVIKLGVRATQVQVIQDNSEEIIPNQAFFTQNVSTLTGTNQLFRHSLIVGAGYQCSPSKVIEIILQVAKEHPKVLKYPAPEVFAIGFGDSSIDFELKFWIYDPLMFQEITSQLVCDIWQAFADNGIEIPYPQRDLHLRSNDTSSQLGIN